MKKQSKPKYVVILQKGGLPEIKIYATTQKEVARVIRVAKSNGINATQEERGK